MSRRVSAAAFAAFLLVAGCGGGNDETKANSPSSQSNSAPQPQQSTSAQPQGSGKFTFSYEDAQSDLAVKGRSMMTDAHYLEDVTANVNDILNVPFDVPVVGKQCGQANAYWNPETRQMEMCYEMIQDSQRMFAAAGDTDPTTSAVNVEIATFYHELGHATLDIYSLPFTGREEDVADQLSAYMLLSPGADGKRDPNGVRIAIDEARMWKLSAAENDPSNPNDLAFYDTHSFDQQRMYNYECWIYGSDPAASANIVTDGLLPQERADTCQGEWDKMSAAWQQMLEPHMK